MMNDREWLEDLKEKAYGQDFGACSMNYYYALKHTLDKQPKHDERLELLGALVDIVEDWLDEKGITVHNEEKEQDEMAANINGSDYDYLSANFEELLIKCGLLDKESA